MTLLQRRQPPPPAQRNYQAYKPFLREDFAYQCVYCQLHENDAGGPRFFTVEHFRPKSLFPYLRTAYSNLLYGCAICNTFKGDDWPADDAVAAGRGYIDPCEHDYGQHLAMTADFQIQGLTDVGQYMVAHLRLNRPQLQKLRRLRQEAAALDQQILELYTTNLATLVQTLDDPLLPAGQKQALRAAQAALQAQQQSYLALVSHRQQPLFDLEDYR